MSTAASAESIVATALIVEDDRKANQILSRMVESLGYEVSAAGSVAEGLKLIEQVPECILLDLMLPDGTGVQILREIRRRQLPIRVAITTGAVGGDVLSAAIALEPDTIFRKPVHFPDIARWLRKAA